MKRAMKTQACIFDLDGTLVDTLADLGAAVNHALLGRGYLPLDLEHYRHFVGHGIRRLCARSLAASRVLEAPEKAAWQGGKAPAPQVWSALPAPYAEAEDEEAVGGILADFYAYYQEHCLDASAPYAGVCEGLRRLAGRGLILGIFSNKEERLCKHIVSELFPDIPFRKVAGMREDCPAKPNPSRLLAWLKDWGLEPGSCWLVGDSAVDAQTAQRAGLRQALVTWGFSAEEDLAPLAQDQELYRSPEELFNALEADC